MALSAFTGGRDPFSDPFSGFVGPLGVTDPFFTGWGGRGLGDFFGGGGRGGNTGRDLSDDDRRRLRERAAILNTDVDWVRGGVVNAWCFERKQRESWKDARVELAGRGDGAVRFGVGVYDELLSENLSFRCAKGGSRCGAKGALNVTSS